MLIGFDQSAAVLEGTTDIEAGLTFLEPVWNQLVRRGKVPADIEARPIDQADLVAVAKLYAGQIGGTFDEIYRRLTDAAPFAVRSGGIDGDPPGRQTDRHQPGRRTAPDVLLVEAVIIDPAHRADDFDGIGSEA